MADLNDDAFVSRDAGEMRKVTVNQVVGWVMR
jgi:hypothetical protein